MNTNLQIRSIRRTPQDRLYLDKSICSLSEQQKKKKHVASCKTQVDFMNQWLLKISAYKFLYNRSTCNPNGSKTCGLIFTHLQ